MRSRENIKYLIVGAGNILLSDEGIGIHIMRALEKSGGLPDCTGYIDIGTSTLDIGSHISSDTKKIAVIDCIRTPDFEPGAVFRLTLEDLRSRQSERFSLHQMEMVDCLKLVSIIEEMPDSIIMGIVPYNISTFSMELSSELNSVFPEILKKVKNEIMDFFNTNA